MIQKVNKLKVWSRGPWALPDLKPGERLGGDQGGIGFRKPASNFQLTFLGRCLHSESKSLSQSRPRSRQI